MLVIRCYVVVGEGVNELLEGLEERYQAEEIGSETDFEPTTVPPPLSATIPSSEGVAPPSLYRKTLACSVKLVLVTEALDFVGLDIKGLHPVTEDLRRIGYAIALDDFEYLLR